MARAPPTGTLWRMPSTWMSDTRAGEIGSALLGAIVEAARQGGHHAIIALIVGGNEASELLHAKHGFEMIGRMREVGRKFDRWLDVLVYEKILDYPVQD